MAKGTVAYKILQQHLVSGRLVPGEEIAIKIDQTLTQDATGTMAYLQLEAMGIDRVKTELSVSYIDHNMLQTDYKNPDDHKYLMTVAKRYGIYLSKPGNGICHQVHLERFAKPGKTLLGSDSHTPTAGGIGMLAIGAGGLDVAAAMAGEPFYMKMPKIVGVHLKGKLPPWVTAKDIILELLRRLTVKGGLGKIFEYFGEGIRELSVPERATITNMGAELGATTSIFPSDDITRAYLRAQGREEDWIELLPDPDAQYDEVIELDLSSLEPLIACPHSPDNVVPVREVEGIKVDQVVIGSCTNSSFVDLTRAAKLLEGRKVHPDVVFAVAPGSKQALELITQNGALLSFLKAGARILETACGPCIGMGFAPPSGGVSVRSFNRNFEGRSGTPDAKVYLASPEVCVACAIAGEIIDPRKLAQKEKITWVKVEMPERFPYGDEAIIEPLPEEEAKKVEIYRGPNIKPLPQFDPLPETLEAEVSLIVGDNITTDHIMPAGAKILPLRSNIYAISEYVYHYVDPEFVARAKKIRDEKKKFSVIIGGENYGQGSSREHAALAPRFLGVRVVIAKSFARIHHANLVNFGILPLEFVDKEDYNKFSLGDEIYIPELYESLNSGKELVVINKTTGHEILCRYNLTPKQVSVLMAGGLLNWIKNKQGVKV
ncbi:aconitate hydratase [Thermocrinis albus DSM 14484]|uniref:Aconitate hydratase A n=1 Tax=Thermocrinis albus (strain DSM 14484 / JCM 11386 / HI 11/12) TaxID=638303 RepID=D3SQ81_THEAH|nr:aconitate hydratase [Thermocrinis albus]ADC89318.1 aconitate hydratase [Thermocrinis albus DSM 14484]